MALSWISSLLSFLIGIFRPRADRKENDQGDHESPLLINHTELRSYATSHASYPSLRTFYHPHAHKDKLKAIADLPLIVFVHGLGGCLPQFALLLNSFVNIAPAFAIELPGHGASAFEPRNYEAYTFEALVELWRVAIEDACERHGHRKVVLICHSMGCSVGASLVAQAQGQSSRTFEMVGLAAICPKSTPPTSSQVKTYRRMLSLPDVVLDIIRWFDRRGGESSASVKRFVGVAASSDLKRLQLKFNQQFKTPVWKRTTIGLLPRYDSPETPLNGLPGQDVWSVVNVPLLLIAGEDDSVTKPVEAANIVSFMQGQRQGQDEDSSTSPDENATATHPPLPLTSINQSSPQDARSSDEKYGLQPSMDKSNGSKPSVPLRSVILPNPASHALMYDQSTYRTVAGLIEDFLAKHVSHSLALGWQLQQLTTSGKWDVKNLEKWKRVAPVSGPIDGGLFRALKTLREQDEEHSPAAFLSKWGGNNDIDDENDQKKQRPQIHAIIDISHDSPVYDTKAIETGGIQYHKFPTVSKIPPTVVEVQNFITLVDRLRQEMDLSLSSSSESASSGTGGSVGSSSGWPPIAIAIAIHCHYGYNRTGFFIVSYLVERRNYTLREALDEFARAKPPGIRHDHFIDTLFVRYCVGLRRGSQITTSLQ